MTSVFAGGPRGSRSSVHYPEQPAYHTSSRGAPSVVYNDSRSEARIPRSSSRRHSVSAPQPRPIIVPRDRSPQPTGARSSVDRFAGGPRSSVDRFGGGGRSSVDRLGGAARTSVDFGGQGRSPPGRRGSIHISDSAGGPRNSSASLRRHDDRDDHREERTRPGTTRFPRKFVNRDAVEEAGWPFEEDRETGAIVVFKALSKKEIDSLVERTSHIRKRRAEGGPQRPSTLTPALAITKPRPTTPARHSEERDKHVAFSPERTTIIHQTDAPPKSISAAVPVGTRHLSREDQKKRDEELEELSRKAKSEMEARMRAEEVARAVRSETAGSARGYGGGGRRLGRDVVVVR
ncbi:hypothetical protein BJ508DRAFT_322766 [Ascobolus immersus RN42]|uniref:DUF8035 domain-containing protein n=1 Tax=Ascobolus immersus RN42 TaxID=1160509 RepID=A0A3N4IGP7_ASCIM|nr:hypothetical protein BJ508DRAFT_322766 [Ascobolus immersus RN42]